jgi:hypothetical protein
MPVVLVPNPSSVSVGGKSKTDLIEFTRFLVDKYDKSWLADSDATRFDLGDALDMALIKWYKETGCSRGTYTHAATASQAIYSRSEFPTGANRIHDLYLVTYNSVLLAPTSVEKLNAFNRNWRSTAAGVPNKWMPWGDTEFRLYPAPSGTSNIVIEGYQGPDLTLFDEDGDEPPGVNAVDHEALAYYAAFLVVFAEQSETGVAKQSWLYQEWQKQVDEAKSRVAGVKNVKVHMGARLDRVSSPWPHDEDVTMI